MRGATPISDKTSDPTLAVSRQMRKMYRLFSWSGLVLVLCLIFTLPAYADGGAPNLAYVAGTTTGISVIDVAQQRVSRTIALPGDPRSVLLSMDGSLLYTTQPLKGNVAILDAATGKTQCSTTVAGEPSVLALSPLADVFYVGSNTTSQVQIFDAKTCARRQEFQAPGPVYGMAISFLGGALPSAQGSYQLLVATTDKLAAFDVDGTPLAQFALPAGPQSLCIPPGPIVYVTTRQGTVVALNLGTRQLTAPLLTGGPFGTMDYDAITGEIYVPDVSHHQLAVLAPVTPGVQLHPGKLIRRVPLNGVPEAVAITSDGQLGFVALQNGQVVMLDLLARHVITTIAVGGHPHFLITGLYPPTNSQPSAGQQGHSGQTVLLLLFFAIFLVSLLLLVFLWTTKRRS